MREQPDRGRSAVFMPGVMDYDRHPAERYDSARGLSVEAAQTWRTAIERQLPTRWGLTMLDLGSGTGRFSPRLADWFEARVIGIEPSGRMRRVARQQAQHPAVRYVAGRAEQLPLRAGHVDVAWLSNVIHHVEDRVACALELRRVLGSGGRVLIAGAFAGRLEEITLFSFFPAAKWVAEQFPAVEAVVESFGEAGFEMCVLERVQQRTCGSLRELAERTRSRADTTLQLISTEDFLRGQAALEEAAAEEGEPKGVVDTLDLLVLA